MRKPDEVWFRFNIKTQDWEWSFAPPYKRHELKFTRMVPAELLDAERERFAQCDDERISLAGLLAAERAKVARLEEACRAAVKEFSRRNESPWAACNLCERALAEVAP